VREQEQTLFGFPNDETRDLFRLLIGRVSGVGPKVGMSILSGMAASDFKQAVVEGDLATISRIKGLGKKTAERVVLELRDKVGVKDAWETQASPTATPLQRARGDAMLGLMALGYKQADARKAVEKVAEDITDADAVLRAALRFLQS
jgi:Holliday junction DNA helicase RuvA